MRRFLLAFCFIATKKHNFEFKSYRIFQVTKIIHCFIFNFFGEVKQYNRRVSGYVSFVTFSVLSKSVEIRSKLVKIKNVYHHQKEHLYFGNHAKSHYCRCNISWENVGWKLRNSHTCSFVWLIIRAPFIQMSVNFSIFNLHFLRWHYTWNAGTLQGY